VTVGQKNLAGFSSKESMLYVQGVTVELWEALNDTGHNCLSVDAQPRTYCINSLEENLARLFCPTVTNDPMVPSAVCSPRTVVRSLMRLGARSSEIIE